MAEELLDLMGLGSLNRDFVVALRDVTDDDRERLRASLRDRERCTNRLTTFIDELDRRTRGARKVDRAYGGSAFNTVRAVTRLSLGLRVGYVAVLGAPPSRQEDDEWEAIPSEVAADAVDGSRIERVGDPSGACVSVVDETGTRDLFTYYNDAVNQALLDPDRQTRLADHLASARHVHVSSILGSYGPAAVLHLLRMARERARTRMTISVDPGYLWAEQVHVGNGGDILAILDLADTVFVNREELELLGESKDAEAAGAALADKCGKAAFDLIVLKDWDRSVLIRPRERTVDWVSQTLLPTPRVADATGGGDVFAAGVLAAQLSQRGAEIGASLVGMTAARDRLQGFGDEGYDRLRYTFARSRSLDGTLFISHHSDDEMLAQYFVNLLFASGIPHSHIFCIQAGGTDTPVGLDWAANIARQLETAKLVISLISRSYLGSEFCHYETAAAWVLGKPNLSLLIPPTKPENLDVLHAPRQAGRVTNADALLSVRERIERAGLAEEIDREQWRQHVAHFHSVARSIIGSEWPLSDS